jgi:hypothetical protein
MFEVRHNIPQSGLRDLKMNSNNNTTQKSGFMTGIRATLERLILRRTHKADKLATPLDYVGYNNDHPTMTFTEFINYRFSRVL